MAATGAGSAAGAGAAGGSGVSNRSRGWGGLWHGHRRHGGLSSGHLLLWRRRRSGLCRSGLLRRGRGFRRRHDRTVWADDEGLHAPRTAVGGVRIVDRRHGRRLHWCGAWSGGGSSAGHRRHGKLFLPRHDALGLRLISILQPFVYQLVLVRKFLAARLLRGLLDGPAVGLNHRRLASAHGPAALLIGKGESATERNGAEQGAAHHVDAAAPQAEFARGFRPQLRQGS